MRLRVAEIHQFTKFWQKSQIYDNLDPLNEPAIHCFGLFLRYIRGAIVVLCRYMGGGGHRFDKISVCKFDDGSQFSIKANVWLIIITKRPECSHI